MTEPTQLEALFPEPRQVVLTSSRAVEILPLPISKVPAFSKAITVATAVLMAGQIQLAIEEHYPGMRSAVSIATGLAEPEIDALLPDDFVALLAAVMEVNLDFFTRRVAPKLRQLAAVIAPACAEPADRWFRLAAQFARWGYGPAEFGRLTLRQMNGLLDAHQEIEAADRRKAAEAMRLAFWAEAGAFDQAMERMGGAPAPDDGTGSITNL